jgi:hypothetical protein
MVPDATHSNFLASEHRKDEKYVFLTLWFQGGSMWRYVYRRIMNIYASDCHGLVHLPIKMAGPVLDEIEMERRDWSIWCGECK